MSFSETVKRILWERDMNPSELARKIGHSPQYVHDLIKGEKRWNEDTINKVCKALDLEITVAQKTES